MARSQKLVEKVAVSGWKTPIMGGPGRLCLPSNSPDSQCHKQDSQPRLWENNSYSTGMAQHVVVLGSSEPVIPDTPLPVTPSQSSDPTIQQEPSQRPSQSDSI